MAYYCGSPDELCDVCQGKIGDAFVDGKTKLGPWANMCVPCHKKVGCGLGTGRGQKYEKQTNGMWLKTEG